MAFSAQTPRTVACDTRKLGSAVYRDAAREDISKPIELVDGDRLVELLEEHEFGLRSTKTYEVDQEFIRNYRKNSKT